MFDDTPTEHEDCGGKLERKFTVSYVPRSIVETVGSFADKQAAKMSEDEKKFRREQQKTKQDSDLPGYNQQHPMWKDYKRYEP